MRVCALICVHDDNEFLAPALRSLAATDTIVCVSRVSWSGQVGSWQDTVTIATECGAEVVLGDWASERAHREAALAFAANAGYTHAIIADSDELLEPVLRDHLNRIAEADLADRVYVTIDTYWKSAEYVIRPREPFTPCMMIRLDVAHHVHLRDFDGGRPMLLDASFGVMHHLSYAGGDARILRKISSWSHRDEVHPRWFAEVWLRWNCDRSLRNLHPTHPEAYAFAERIPLPELLVSHGVQVPDPRQRLAFDTSKARVSIVIPAYGGQDDVEKCLQSLRKVDDLIHEIVVVDDASPEKIHVPETALLLRNPTNIGFAGSCNVGWRSTSGDVVVFLNSDTVVTRAGFVRLIETLTSSGSIAAAGPMSNAAGHGQAAVFTYQNLDTLELFAEDFAERAVPDQDTDMLVGFCMAVKRGPLEEVGAFDERFGTGYFEDNDLSYRLRRAGYRLVIAARAFIHHVGSRSMDRMSAGGAFEPHEALTKNEAVFRAKWKRDIESGFANTLSGLGPTRIRFSEAQRPETIVAKLSPQIDAADISLCMIVKDEERVLGACLASVKPFVREMLVLDTGSTDATPQLAASAGARVRSCPWPSSFAIARTESMRDASGKWILWLDADDTLPFTAGEEIVRAAASAPNDVVAFVVPVRFVEDGGHGTTVDHVKLFRNWPELQWEGRIHEQILPSLRAAALDRGLHDGGRIVRLGAYVEHTGYDTSEAGQKKKRDRDAELLALDLKDRPDHPFVLFNLGMTAHFTGDHDQAVDWFQRSIGHSTDRESHVRKALALLAGSLRALGRTEELAAVLLESLGRFPGDPELSFMAGQMQAANGDHLEAIAHYEAVLRSDLSGVFSSIDRGVLSFKARHNLAVEYVHVGRYEDARQQWVQALAETARPELALALARSAIDHGDLTTLRSSLMYIRDRFGRSETWLAAVEAACEAVGLDVAAYLQGLLATDWRDLTTRTILATRLLNSGQVAEAIPHLDFLQSQGVPQGAYFLGVLAEQDGHLAKARAWYARAQRLNPRHRETAERVEVLDRALNGPVH